MTSPISTNQTANITKNLQQIQQNITNFCLQYNRQPSEVQLLAVSKTKPAEDIRAAYMAGQRKFGENYLQEAIQKMKDLDDLDIEWHFIGAIQSNKTRDLAENFSWVHSVDRLKIARRLNDQRPASLPPLNICLEINISKEQSKSGLALAEADDIIEEVNTLPRLNLRGLMAIPAKADGLDQQRAIFAKMKHALTDLQKKYPHLDTLSMGMSNDMQAAIAEGSTIVRIGTAIFGQRNT